MGRETNAVTIVGPMPNTPEWYVERHSCIGASQAAAACGLSRWRQPLDVYLEILGLKEDQLETDAMRLGKALEAVVLSEYTTRTGITAVGPQPLCRWSGAPFIAATPDAMTDGLPDDHPVEAKSTSHWYATEFGEEGTDEIPAEYVIQAQQQMLVMDCDVVDVPVLIDGRTLRIYKVVRNQRTITRMIDLETELWQRIQERNPPEPIWRHPGTLDLVRTLYSRVPGTVVPLADDTISAWRRGQKASEVIKALEEIRDAAKAKVLHALGDNEAGEFEDGTVIRRTVVAESYWTEEDIEAARAKVGTIKRRGYETLKERKPKHVNCTRDTITRDTPRLLGTGRDQGVPPDGPSLAHEPGQDDPRGADGCGEEPKPD